MRIIYHNLRISQRKGTLSDMRQHDRALMYNTFPNNRNNLSESIFINADRYPPLLEDFNAEK